MTNERKPTEVLLGTRMWCPLRAKDTTIGECLGCSYQDGHCPRGPEVLKTYGHLIKKEASMAEKKSKTTKKVCTFPGCNKPHLARGYCGAHYQSEFRRNQKEKKQRPAKPKPRRAGKRPTGKGEGEFFVVINPYEVSRVSRTELVDEFRKGQIRDDAVVIQGRQVSVELDVRIVEE